MAVTEELFREAWGKFATGVTIVTTIQEDGSVYCMTANALCSVSMDPFLMLLCVDHQRNTYRYLTMRRRFGVNILAEGQEAVAVQYAISGSGNTDLAQGSVRFTPSGTAVLDESLAFLDCRVVAEHPAGDHTIFVAEVDYIEVKPGTPLLFYQGTFTSLAPA